MRVGRIMHGDGPVLALELGGCWVNLTHAYRDYNKVVEEKAAPMLDRIEGMLGLGLMNRSFYRRMTEFVQRHGRLDSYRLDAPLEFLQPLRPGKVVAIGRNYKKHVEEFDNKMPTEPIFFAKSPSVCIGPDAPIQVRGWYGRVDHEGELGVVIGKAGKDIPAADAESHIGGYTLVNDVTAREIQKADIAGGNPWYRSKNLDTFCPIGPVVVFREALHWPVETPIEVKVNGEIRQSSNTAKFIFDLPTLIEAVSRFMTLEVGDVISTGTPEGVGPLRPGDVVEVSVPAIGVLRNPVIGE